MSVVSYDEFIGWAVKRENLIPADETFYAYEEAWDKAILTLNGVQPWVDEKVFELLVYNLTLHNIICTEFWVTDTEEEEYVNPLYTKYKIAEIGAGIITSASDESSSASIQVIKAVEDLDFFTLELVATPYGKYVFNILSQLNAIPVLL